jgi:hypothetical protein
VLRATACTVASVAASDIRTRFSAAADPEKAAVDLYWLPLGAGGNFVRLNGRVFEAVASRVERRPACDLYHSALEVRVAAARFVIEQTPVLDARGEGRGVVAEGPVGTRWAGRFRIFRYEIRRWLAVDRHDARRTGHTGRVRSVELTCGRRSMARSERRPRR